MNTFLVSFDTVEHIFWNIRKRIPKSAIMYVLMKQQEYYEKSDENTINETAFMSLFQYICREVELSDFGVDDDIIQSILDEEANLQIQKYNRQHFQFIHATG